MIEKASELLERFIEVETKKLAGISMPHMPTLGNAYEEITKQGFSQDFSIPKSLGLNVLSGFVSIGGEMLPQQIDCMLVYGDGTRYGVTDQYIYDIEQILCLFEVKKTLNKHDFEDAYEHLGEIRKRFASNFEEKLRTGKFEPNLRAARKAFSQITSHTAPQRYLELHSLPKEQALLFYTLVQESLAPISIIHGYNGYKTETGLRKAMIDLLESKLSSGQTGGGVPRLPTLVTANNYCLVKANGVPYIHVKDERDWVAVFSTRHNPIRVILELIWAKISLHFNIEMPWNDGLFMETGVPLLIATPMEKGWQYGIIDLKESMLKRPSEGEWKPAILGKAEVSAISRMAFGGGWLEIDEEAERLFSEQGYPNLDSIMSQLLKTREFMRDGNGLRPINTVTHIIINEDGTGYVSSERERFEKWCEQKGVNPYFLNLLLLDE